MTQDEFVAARELDWAALEALLDRAQMRGIRRMDGPSVVRTAALYRALAGDLARAEGQGYSPELREQLERLAGRAHAVVHAAPPWDARVVWRFLAAGFAREVRAQRLYVGLASALFYGPFVVGLCGTLASTAFATRVLPTDQLAQAAQSFGESFGTARTPGESIGMFGFYVWNNVGIAFRCFATGVFFGLGSVFFLVYNGLLIGGVFGHVASLGYAHNILAFTSGHSAFELTAIVISGAAGLRMGDALVRTHGETRLGSLRRAGPEVFRLVLGAAAMLVIAAVIEGLWSGSGAPAPIKYAVGLIGIVLVTSYFLRAGRTAEEGHA